jgi:hypothetical protein
MINPFKKPDAIARHLKIAVTGKSGSGKTVFGLAAKKYGLGRVAVISTEAGDVHYVDHPDWGDFDRIATQNLDEFEGGITFLEKNAGTYKTLLVDTVTGLYEALVEAKSKDDGSVSMKDWGLIKRRWKSVMARLNNLPVNIVAVVHENDLVETDAKGSSKIVGQKLDAEKTFERNPDVLIRMLRLDSASETIRTRAVVLKDRTGTFRTGQTIDNPHIGMWAKAIKADGKEERIAPPEETAKANEAAMAAEPEQPAQPDRTADELVASALEAACKAGFNAVDHRKRWLKKHAAEIEGLKARHPDLYAQVKAAYDAAHVKQGAANEPQEAA